MAELTPSRIIVVSSAALRSSGGLTVYKQFVGYLPDNIGHDHYIIFVDDSMPRPDIEGVEYVLVNLRNPIRRIWFDWVGCRCFLKRGGIVPDSIVSLQNTGLRCFRKYPQLIYYHQSLPFYSRKLSFFKSSERTLWYYKHIYGWFVKCSLGPKTRVVVQIPHIKREFVEKFRFPEESVFVCFPDSEEIDKELIKPYEWNDRKYHFIYPATAYDYKNHCVLIKAMDIINQSRPDFAPMIRIHFTFPFNKHLKPCLLVDEYALNSQFVFSPQIPHSTLLSYYAGSTALLFPSTLETIGLPLIEAASLGIGIIAADLEYARDVLGDYEGVVFCPSDDASYWAREIMDACKKRLYILSSS